MIIEPNRAASERISLSQLFLGPGGALTMAGSVDLADYSRFKHGDLAVASTYGAALAEAFAARLSTEVTRLKVTSSAFGFVPPAAYSLVAPFVDRLRAVTHLEVEYFKVDRLTVTNGDYATMPIEQRKRALGDGSLLVDPQASLVGEHVVAVDDVRITGTHEAVMDDCLVKGGAASVQHLYVVDAFQSRHNPVAEGAMNAASVRTTADLTDIANSPTFAPNARFCKWVITLPEHEMIKFIETAPEAVTRWVVEAVALDALHRYPAYAAGAAAFRRMAAGDIGRVGSHTRF
ncbi:phosphoribosyltransferase family protein [Pedococcus sp. KACC 23699]|uniref:Phosphoribosyltransferase family protein n=1 Tax=Pedococcus sp. KACC 23699 TaxID=3149228 RepID=A0AAU7JXM3_9MICO